MTLQRIEVSVGGLGVMPQVSAMKHWTVGEFQLWLALHYKDRGITPAGHQNIAQRGRFFRVTDTRDPTDVEGDELPRRRVAYYRQSSEARHNDGTQPQTADLLTEPYRELCEALFATQGDVNPTTLVGTHVRGCWEAPLAKVYPYEYITEDFDTGTDYRLVLYGAYNAMGLIGSESNGVAVFDNFERQVIADEIACAHSGWGGPTPTQRAIFYMLTRLLVEDHRGFANVVNTMGFRRLRNRVRLEPQYATRK